MWEGEERPPEGGRKSCLCKTTSAKGLESSFLPVTLQFPPADLQESA